MDGGARRIGWAGALVLAAGWGTIARGDVPPGKELINDLPAAAHADVFADKGGVTIEPVGTAPSADEAAAHLSGEPAGAAVAPDPAPTGETTSDKPTSEEKGTEETGGAGDALTGVGDEVKRGDGEGDASAAAPSAESAREGLPLGGVRDAQKKGFGAATTTSPMGGLAILRTIGAVGVVVLLIVLTRVLLVRLSRVGNAGIRSQLGPGGRAPSGIVQILGRYPVARGQTLVLLKLDRRVLLLSQTGAGFNTLSEIVDAEEVASILSKSRDEEGESLTARFGALLRRFERDPGFGEGDDVEIAPYLRRPSLDEIDGFEDSYASAPEGAPEPEDPGEALRRRLEGLRGLSA